jgi:hypothetical protein
VLAPPGLVLVGHPIERNKAGLVIAHLLQVSFALPFGHDAALIEEVDQAANLRPGLSAETRIVSTACQTPSWYCANQLGQRSCTLGSS